MNHIEKIRAALEQAGEYIRSDLASERGAFEGHEGVSRIDEIKVDLENNKSALAALAELEKAAAEPVGIVRGTVVEWTGAPAAAGTKLYTAPPPAPVAEIREPWKLSELTQEMCQRVAASFYGADTFANGVEMNEALQLWRKELGPALGMVELKEPTPEECERICTEYERLLMREGTCGGRDAFDAVRAVMWPKEVL